MGRIYFDPATNQWVNEPDYGPQQPQQQQPDFSSLLSMSSDPLLSVLIQALQQQSQQQPSTGYEDEMGNWVGPIGGRAPSGMRAPTVPETPAEQSISRGQESRIAMAGPEQMEANYLQNQGVAAGLTDAQAFAMAQEAVLKKAALEQKSNYADVLLATSAGKRESEALERQRKEEALTATLSQKEAERKSKEGIEAAKISLGKEKMNQDWSELALQQIGVAARTQVVDPVTGASRFPTPEEMDQYINRLKTLPGAIIQKPLAGGDAKVDQLLSQLPQNPITQKFRQLVQEKGLKEALRILKESPSVPEQLKQLAEQKLAPFLNAGQ